MSPSSQLCVRCGLCCDGSLFDHAAISEAEANALRGTKAATLKDADGQHAIRLRCGALNGKCCSLYATRPSICRTFKCSLLRGLEAGEVTLDEAFAVVDETLALRDEAKLNAANGPLLKQVLAAAPKRSSASRSTIERLTELVALRFLPDDA